MQFNKIILYKEDPEFQQFINNHYFVESEGLINRNKNLLKNRIECAGFYILYRLQNIVTSDNQKGSIDINTDNKKIMREILLLKYSLPDYNIWLDFGNVKN